MKDANEMENAQKSNNMISQFDFFEPIERAYEWSSH